MFKRDLIFVLLLLILAGCASSSKNVRKEGPVDAVQSITSMVIKKSSNLPDKRIAVLDFTSIEGDKSLEGKLLSGRVINSLVNEGSIAVVERSQIEKIIEEQKLQISGLIDSSTAKDIGKILGVEALVIGTITDLGELSEVNARLTNIENGVILGSFTGQQPRSIDYEKLKASYPEEVEKLKIERNESVRLKAENPKEFKRIIARKRRLIKLRDEKPVLFRRIMKTKTALFRLARKNPEKLRLLMRPEPPPFKDMNRRQVKRIVKLIKQLFPVEYMKLREMASQPPERPGRRRQ